MYPLYYRRLHFIGQPFSFGVYSSHMNDEYLDLVDEKDNVIGKKLRSEVYAEGLSNFRVVNAFIVNSQGKLWIPLRGPNKGIFPLSLDMSMGGHVESGETYDQAFMRETQEELGIDTNATPWKMLGHLTPSKDNTAAYMNVYEIQSDTPPNYNPDDYTEYFWLTPHEVLEKIETGTKTKDDLPKLIKIFYEK